MEIMSYGCKIYASARHGYLRGASAAPRRRAGTEKQQMKAISKVRHYRRTKNGAFRLVGIEEVEVEEHHWGHVDSLDWRDQADARRLAREQENFEALVDAACGE